METTNIEPDLIPRAEVFANAAAHGLEPSDDRFDRFRAAGLIEDLGHIKGTNERAFTRPQAQRFIHLLVLCKRLGSKRPRACALAFWLCWYGYTDVPPELVCEHVERSVLRVLRFLRRQYDRRRVPKRSASDSDRWRRAGMPWVKPFVREILTSFANNGIMLDFLSTVVGVVLRTLFSKTSFDIVAPILKRLAFLVGAKEVNVEAMRTLWDVAAEGLQLFTTDERRNPLLGAIREINAQNPSEVIALVHDAHRTHDAMAHVFPIYRAPEAPQVADPKNDAAVTLTRLFPPGVVSALALTRTSPHSIEMRQNLRTGNVEPVLREFYQVKVVRDSIFARIREEQP